MTCGSRLPGGPAPWRIERLAGPGCAASLARLHGAAFTRAWDAKDFASVLGDGGAVAHGVFVADAGEPAGFALSRRVLDEAELLAIVVAPEIRRRGCGRALLGRHLADLARDGTRVVHLEVEAENEPALALYARAGFAEVGRRPGYYGKSDGRRVSARLLSLTLADDRDGSVVDGASPGRL